LVSGSLVNTRPPLTRQPDTGLQDTKSQIMPALSIPNDPAYFLKIIELYRKSIAVGVESTFNWYRLADRLSASFASPLQPLR
ncbi:MAG: hypothetical protein QME81_15315, partial [bacterium]|nr:hypothetical protein [bacterium]